MKRRTLILAIPVVLTLLIVFSGCRTRAPEADARDTVVLFDREGTRLTVSAPLEKIISVNSGMTALVCALGGQDRLVGRDTFSTFPEAARQVEAVAESSANCNLELIISKVPDLVVADPMFYPQHREKLDAAGIPCYVDSTSDPDRLLTLIRSMGLVLDEDERAEEIIQFVTRYTDIVNQRINKLELEDGAKPKVFFEWHSRYKTASAETTFHKAIAQAGGINIAAGQPIHTPVMSCEWVVQQNPDVIVNRISGDATLAEMERAYQDIITRPGWENIDAVKNDRVHIIKADIFLTFRYPVGLLYYAKWFHPELFADIDPEAVHQEAIQTFFSQEEWETLQRHEAFVYPE